ncbi:MAG: hypothetical protein ABJO09_20465 [Hyphomicrobiales bacterium]
MVFHTIAVGLLVAAVPLWIVRFVFLFNLEKPERQIFRNLVKRRFENAIGFALRIFGYLFAVSAAIVILVFGVRYIKFGSLQITPYRELIHSRLYSGVRPIDSLLDAFHYNQIMPVAVISTCLLLSIAFTLVMVALRDIFLMRKLSRKLQGLKMRKAVTR